MGLIESESCPPDASGVNGGQAPLNRLNAIPTADLAHHRDLVLGAFQACRSHSLALVEPLSPEDMQLQSMPDASPAKWHLAHTSWFFETFILQHHEPQFRWHEAQFQVLFNSYYNGIGEQFPRAQRGLLSRPGLADIYEYRRRVDDRIANLLTRDEAGEELTEICHLLRLGVNHEQQHQELLLTDIKHALAQNPAWPAYSRAAVELAAESVPVQWIDLQPGIQTIGCQDQGFCFDNELPAHEALLAPARLAQRRVSNGEWLEFLNDGGYRNPLLWLDAGWAWRQSEGVTCPLYWKHTGEGWSQFTLAGEQELAPNDNVAHISYFEADAFARWAGCRLPTEFEWEAAAAMHAIPGNSGSGVTEGEFSQLWDWTGSAYLPYPGFNAPAGAVGEYNGKFMINQMVLRGFSSATPAGHRRLSYRNFFPTQARWQFTGVRLAKNPK